MDRLHLRRHARRLRLHPALLAAVAIAGLLAVREAPADAQASLSALIELRESVSQRLPRPTAAALDALDHRSVRPADPELAAGRAGIRGPLLACATHEGNPVSGLVAQEDNPAAAHLEGFVLRDPRGRKTRPWRAPSRADVRKRGVVVHRPLLVFMETPPQQEDMSAPWYGPVRFDRPGFPTTKEKIAEQIFGKDFDHRDPNSVAGFYYRESGGQLVIAGDASSIYTVTIPHMYFDAERIAAAIVAQLDPVVDFTKRADAFGWVDPIFVVSPFSYYLDTYDASMGRAGWIGYGPTVFDIVPAITSDPYPDGTHAALSSLAIGLAGGYLGANEAPTDAWFGLSDDQIRRDLPYLYAHEYGHAIGLPHLMTQDYGQLPDDSSDTTLHDRFDIWSLSRDYGTGFATTIMNYSVLSGPLELPVNKHYAGLDAFSRSKLGWGNVTEITFSDDGRGGPGRLRPGDALQTKLVEHLGQAPGDPRPQILKVNLPPRDVSLFPRTDPAGSPSGYWRPGTTGTRMVWSGRMMGGSRTMERTIHIPADSPEPVLGFWTKYGAHAGWAYEPGWEFGWVEVSTDQGQTWTTLSGLTSSTYVAPGRDAYDWVGETLGAPAFTGDSRWFAADGWIFERMSLPAEPGSTVRVRFRFSGLPGGNEQPSHGYGWWIDEVYVGPAADPARHLVSDFENDAARWSGLLPEFDQGFGFAVVEETTPFPQAYLFELRGNNPHDEMAFKSDHRKPINGWLDAGLYTYEPGVVGYFLDYYSSFWAYPVMNAGSATHRPVPIDRLRRMDIKYPIHPQSQQLTVYDFAGALAAAFDPASGITLDDVAFAFTFPTEVFALALIEPGLVFPYTGRSPSTPPLSLLDASPTYRPSGVMPAVPQTPFPERPAWLWPYILGSPGGWPKTAWHGELGLQDPTTVRVLGQPYLARDAAFHPDRNPIFDDSVDYRGAFATEFYGWHAPTTAAAFGSATPSERTLMLPTTTVPVSPTESIQLYAAKYCFQDAAGQCVPQAQAVSRPWIEQILYQRLAPMVYFTILAGCPAVPAEVTLATRPEWEAFFACRSVAANQAHGLTNLLLESAANLGNNPIYAGLNAYGDRGTLSPDLWALFYLSAWAHAKAPASLPSHGVSVEVTRITGEQTPMAHLTVRRRAQ